MNWREGFRRVARATAIVYWTLALLIIGLVVYNGGMMTTQRFSFGRNGVSYLAVGYDKADAEARFEKYLKLNPQTTAQVMTWGGKDPIATFLPWDEYPEKFSFAEGSKALLPGLGIAFAIYAVGWVIFRGLRWIACGFVREDAQGHAH